MNDTVKTDVLAILERVIEILKSKEVTDVLEIKELSDHTIHNASIFQDEDSIAIAVTIYAIYKLVDRGVEGEVYTNIFHLLKQAKKFLERNKERTYRVTIKTLLKAISKQDTKLRLYVEQVIIKAKIKKSSRLFEHGISLARAAEVLGISQWELLNYVGKTQIVDKQYIRPDLRKRLNVVRELFR